MLPAVIQEDKSGCGIAACAALIGLDYATVKKCARTLGIDPADKRLWSDTAYVYRLLTHYGIRLGQESVPFTSWPALPDKALLAIKWHEINHTPFWHWVVFVRDGQDAAVLDSKAALKNHLRRDFGRMQPKWFIEVFD